MCHFSFSLMLAFAQYQRLYSRRRCRDRDLAMARELDGQTCAVRQGLQTLQQFEPAPVGLLGRFVARPMSDPA